MAATWRSSPGPAEALDAVRMKQRERMVIALIADDLSDKKSRRLGIKR